MVNQEEFYIERWFDEYENDVELNISETCCHALSLDQIAEITGTPVPNITAERQVYGAIPGSTALRSAVARMYNETSSNAGAAQLHMQPDNVLTTNGAIGANFLVYYGLVGPGDHVVVADPIYQQLKSVPAMFGADVSVLPLAPDNGYLPRAADLERLIAAARHPTKLIILNSPHNPSGSVMPTNLLREFVAVARRHGAYLQCDEVYRPMWYGAPADVPPSVVALGYERAISTGSTSKAFGLAGLRVGWIVSGDRGVLQTCLARRDYNMISTGVVADRLAAWAVAGYRAIVAHNTARCRAVLAVLDAFVSASNGAVSYVKPQGGTTTFLRIHGVPKDNTTDFCKDFIDKHKTLIVPGETFGKPGYIRLGFGNDLEDVKEGLARLKAYLVDKKYVDAPWGA